MMQVDIHIVERGADPPFPELADKVREAEGVVQFVVLEGGMQSGKPSVMLLVPRSSEEVVLVQLSAEIFEAMAAAVRGARARWGA